MTDSTKATGEEPVAPVAGTQRKHKSPNTYVILFVAIALVAILSWFIPGGAYKLNAAGEAISGTYHTVTSNPQGIWDVFLAPIVGMVGNNTITGAISISLFIMLFGGFLEMMDETNAIKKGLKKLTVKNQNNMYLLIALLVIVMSIFGTVEGAYEEGIVYLLLLLPVVLSLGLDTIVAVMIVVLGTQIGCLASVVNPFSTGVASGIAGISLGAGMGLRTIIWVVMTALVILLICLYAKRIKAHPEKSMQFFRHEQDKKEFPVSEERDIELTRSQKGVLATFVGLFVIMIVSLVPWSTLNSSWTFFEKFASAISATPILGTVLGHDITPFGSWYFNELSMLLVVMTFLAGFIMHYDVNKIINILFKGAAVLVPTALVVPLARGIQVVMNGGLITPTVLHFGEVTLSALSPAVFVVVALVFYFILACFIPSSTGLAAASMSIMAALSSFAHVPVALMVIIFCMALGMAKMVTPTSIVVMTCTEATHIGYSTWVKKIVPYVGIMFAACCVFLWIGLAVL